MRENDPFAPIGQQEAQIVKDLSVKIDVVERRIAFVKSILVIKQSPGWAEYVKQVQILRDAKVRQVLDEDPGNREYLAGACAALDWILNLIRDGEDALKRAVSELEDLKVKAGSVLPGGRVRPM